MGKWNPTDSGTWRDAMERNALIFPDKLCIISPSQDKELTFAELNARVNRVVNGLLALGLEPGDRVAILANDSIEYVEVAAISKSGIAGVPINWRLKEAEISYIINDAGARAVVAGSKQVEILDAIRAEIPTVTQFICIDGAAPGYVGYEDMLAQASDADPEIDVGLEDLIAIIYTSGTTGRPKGVIKRNRDTMRMLRLINALGQLVNSDRVLGLYPLFHVGLIHGLFNGMLWGCSQWLLPRFDPEAVLKLVHEARITNLFTVPTMLIRLMDHPNFSQYDMSSLRSIVYTGSPMPVEALRRGQELFGPVFYQGYGMTEGTGQTVLNTQDHIRAITEPGKEYLLSSVGKVLPGCEMRIVDDDDNDVPPGTPGEIVFRGLSIIDGYWNNPEASAELLRNGWMHTGDIGKQDSDGYLYLVDRKKDIIVSGGENISSVEVEEVIYGHPAVLECAVIGVPSEEWGETVKAVVSLKRDAAATPEEIMEFCIGRMGDFKRPRSVEVWPELPKSPVGKILKKEIKEKYWAGRDKRIA